jgi:hypothetical protein
MPPQAPDRSAGPGPVPAAMHGAGRARQGALCFHVGYAARRAALATAGRLIREPSGLLEEQAAVPAKAS